jgi:hypothetical protein
LCLAAITQKETQLAAFLASSESRRLIISRFIDVYIILCFAATGHGGGLFNII